MILRKRNFLGERTENQVVTSVYEDKVAFVAIAQCGFETIDRVTDCGRREIAMIAVRAGDKCSYLQAVRS